MKKLFAFVFLFACTYAGAAGLDAQVERQTLANEMMNAHFTVGLPLVSDKLTRKVTGCKAYAIDEHWLMMGTGCLTSPSEKEEFQLDEDGTILLQRNGYKMDYYSLGKNINGKRDLEVFIDDNIMLFKFDTQYGGDKYAYFTEVLQSAPKVNLLAFKQQTPQDVKGTFKIHTARLGTNALRTRELLKVNPDKHLLSFKERRMDLSGTSTDPVFLTNTQDLRSRPTPGVYNNTYWMGVNVAPTTWGAAKGSMPTTWHGETGRYYHYFTLKDVQFIKRILSKHDSAAWKRVSDQMAIL